MSSVARKFNAPDLRGLGGNNLLPGIITAPVIDKKKITVAANLARGSQFVQQGAQGTQGVWENGTFVVARDDNGEGGCVYVMAQYLLRMKPATV